MVLLCSGSPPPITALLYSTPPLKPFLKPLHRRTINIDKWKVRKVLCRAEFSQDAPFAAAIGACMLSSLIFPATESRDDEEEEEDSNSIISSGDMRVAAMGIISFIPYFNWLSWVFAWLDTGKRRYAVYSLVYLAPYIRSNLSLSPDESWLPIASIFLCIVHVQLEASIRNGDLQGFQLFSRATEHLSSINRKKDKEFRAHQGRSEASKREQTKNLVDADQRSRDEIRRWGDPKKPSEHHDRLNGGWDDDDKREE